MEDVDVCLLFTEVVAGADEEEPGGRRMALLTGMAILRHFSERSASLRFWASSSLPILSSSEMPVRPACRESISEASSIQRRSRLWGRRLVAERIEERVERRDTDDSSEAYVLSERADTLRLGGRMKPPGNDVECDVDGLLVRTLRLRTDEDKGEGRAVMEPERDAGRFGVMKP
jgi:hypothetical protein